MSVRDDILGRLRRQLGRTDSTSAAACVRVEATIAQPQPGPRAAADGLLDRFCFDTNFLSPSDALYLEAGSLALALSERRSYSSTAITTTTDRPYFSMATGSALARSMSRPKLFLASRADMRCMNHPQPVGATLAINLPAE